jgi:glucan phosphoethanolaminetransferase (alkaline phosphatase superfamily)
MNKQLFLTAAKIFAITVFVGITNEDVFGRIYLLVSQGRLTTSIMFVGVWGLCMACLTIAAFQPHRIWRWMWAGIITVTSFVGFTYLLVSQSQLTVFDIASLWAAVDDANRSLSFYLNQVILSLVIAVFGFIALAMKPPHLGHLARKWLIRLKYAPVLPIGVILGIVMWNSGGGTHALPQQFTPAAMGIVVAAKNIINERAVRQKLTKGPFKRAAARHIVLLIDESIRPDYINHRPGNRGTPFLGARRNLYVNFGKASSGNNCSHYANAILRLGAGANNVTKTVNTSPSIWQYAKRAGFRTVYIDAAASHIKNAGKLQNFMTQREYREIDEVVTIDDVPAPELDFKLAQRMAEILARPEPHFIYANKNGAHFPYDDSYPASQKQFRPAMNDGNQGTELERKVNSYRNAIRWSVDKFFNVFLSAVDLKQVAVIYTSDHGQNLVPGKITHCSTTLPNPREGLVPLMIFTQDSALKARFVTGAELNFNRANHFAIFPTLLDMFGYQHSILSKDYGSNLFAKIKAKPAFTAGDIFGLFSNKIQWQPLNVNDNHLESATPVFTASKYKKH